VFGEGDPDSSIMFIGEAPGADEDEQGIPFVGRAGKKLTEMIEHPRSLNTPRSAVYICNILKCRPPDNRNPLPAEIRACTPFLLTQIQTVKPKVICALGTFAAQWLLQTKEPISKLRETTGSFQGIPVIPTFHPSYIIRNPTNTQIRKWAWDDMMRVHQLAYGQNDKESGT